MSYNHRCHWVGCSEDVLPSLWGCRRHWFSLPKQFRKRIWEVYQPGQENGKASVSQEYLDVADQIQAWIISTGRAL